ncbi:hypothetical protein GCM10011391_29670 [Pullulanibacillus camelliae]|uniref:Uncharacterized protein n=1 Tax=Pullulanibacillus camelliae TaxID=1707096 RepID=A0A8J3DXT5_9BACL|nr:hypothetical protein [Pullulanibacillus camelliae]GGE48896.1 hypothetical protein GCM10011391_29670 [Pullulanibacillus camelliae]
MFFRRKKQSKRDRALHELTAKMDQLEAALEQVLKNGITYEVNIENFNVHDPVLKELMFRFDKLDVKEVSGALNLGNNFGVKVGENAQKKRASEKDFESGFPRKFAEKKAKSRQSSQWVRHEKGMTWNNDK